MTEYGGVAFSFSASVHSPQAACGWSYSDLFVRPPGSQSATVWRTAKSFNAIWCLLISSY